jgi:hypothetical protein
MGTARLHATIIKKLHIHLNAHCRLGLPGLGQHAPVQSQAKVRIFGARRVDGSNEVTAETI